uniref:Uncharacterized protein n=1 Tax=Anguilla anguilla TaxID=7936 RepID=A0A0E9SBE8_ANGAN
MVQLRIQEHMHIKCARYSVIVLFFKRNSGHLRSRFYVVADIIF